MRFKYIFLISIISLFFSLFLAKPKIEEIRDMMNMKEGYWATINIKKADPTNNLQMYYPEDGRAKYVFRLTVPVFMRIAHISHRQMYGIQIAAGFFIFLLWTLISASFISDWRYVLLSSLALSGVYFGRCFCVDPGTAVNTLSFLLILFCIFFRHNPWLLFAGLFCLFFNDERGIMAFSIIGAFILFWDSGSIGSIRSLISNKSLLVLIGTFVLGVVVRIALQVFYGMHLPLGSVGYDVFMDQWKSYQMGVFSGLVGFAGLIVWGLSINIRSRQYGFVVVVIGIIAAYLYVTAVVMDMTKTIAYVTPLSLLVLRRTISIHPVFIQTLIFVCIINTIFPAYTIIGNKFDLYYCAIYDVFFKLISILHI